MPNAVLWQAAPTSRSTVLTTELNSLANGSRTNAGTAIDNSTNLDMFGWLELAVTFGSAPSADAYIAVYMVTSLDGTNYADGSSTVAPGADTWVINIPLNATTSAQNKQVGPIALPPTKIKFIVENKSGQAFPASGSTLKLYTDNPEVQ
jgi:hypothetical protein